MLFGKLCQRNVGWKHVETHTEHSQPKDHLKNKEHTVKGFWGKNRKTEMQWMKIEKN